MGLLCYTFAQLRWRPFVLFWDHGVLPAYAVLHFHDTWWLLFMVPSLLILWLSVGSWRLRDYGGWQRRLTLFNVFYLLLFCLFLVFFWIFQPVAGRWLLLSWPYLLGIYVFLACLYFSSKQGGKYLLALGVLLLLIKFLQPYTGEWMTVVTLVVVGICSIILHTLSIYNLGVLMSIANRMAACNKQYIEQSRKEIESSALESSSENNDSSDPNPHIESSSTDFSGHRLIRLLVNDEKKIKMLTRMAFTAHQYRLVLFSKLNNLFFTEKNDYVMHREIVALNLIDHEKEKIWDDLFTHDFEPVLKKQAVKELFKRL